MYSDKKNILQLVALLKAHGVRKIVLCPGSRNAAIVHTLANIEDFTCYSVTDERSAGFFAIGLSLQGGGPAAVSDFCFLWQVLCSIMKNLIIRVKLRIKK